MSSVQWLFSILKRNTLYVNRDFPSIMRSIEEKLHEIKTEGFLYHRTRTANIRSILTHGILSIAELAARSIKYEFGLGSEAQKYLERDHDRAAYRAISLSDLVTYIQLLSGMQEVTPYFHAPTTEYSILVSRTVPHLYVGMKSQFLLKWVDESLVLDEIPIDSFLGIVGPQGLDIPENIPLLTASMGAVTVLAPDTHIGLGGFFGPVSSSKSFIPSHATNAVEAYGEFLKSKPTIDT